jgi:hypothetical protein
MSGRAVGARLQRQGEGRLLPVCAQELIRVVRVSDLVDVGERNARHPQAVVYGMVGQLIGGERHRALGVLDPGKALLFHRRKHPAVPDQASG